MPVYPASASERDRFILERRGARPHHDPWRHQGVLIEDERGIDGRPGKVATVFLTGRECPWKCVMCDLWQFTIAEDTPRGAIPAQIAAARAEWRAHPDAVTTIKLYNAGSFFDPRAVPEADYDSVAAALDGLSRAIVESHPALIGSRVDQFLEALHRPPQGQPAVQLEVAMGLETAHPGALQALNKRMTVDDFVRAASRLRGSGVDLRAFLLIQPPFVPLGEQRRWLLESIDVAFSNGAHAVSLIPSRSGNGALESLTEQGAFQSPGLYEIERSFELALEAHARRGRIFVDLWDLQRFSTCAHCLEPRRARLRSMNLEQRLVDRLSCAACGLGATA
jgi:hypothetical protein